MSQFFKPPFSPEAFHRFYSVFDAYNQKLVALAKTLLDFEPGRILDMACGTGLSTAALRASFADADIVAIDVKADMIEFAKAGNRDPKLDFRATGVAESLRKAGKGSFELVFTKSAYHYFDQQILLSQLMEVLGETGAIIIAERTSRSARSYPLPEMVQSYWAEYFGASRVASRFAAAEASNLRLSVSCFGRHVEVPMGDYRATVDAEELFGLSAMKSDLLHGWMADALAEDETALTVYEEFWLYIYQHH